ncbi:Monooxygenase FAD-binding [Penicillium canescens]|nr:Monooxygenase FAD-binding [Penicillium canescens]
MAPFTVIIIGGSVAGLTLANILERYDIEYILLEKYKEIAPQLGASIGILPYGSQVLDQLGLEGQISSLCERVERMQTFGPAGECLGTEDTFGQLLADLTGYKFSFLDRHKSKVLVSKEIFKIEELDDKVQIITKGGATFTGDLLVGADGVHSRTRAEMWSIAEAEDPDYGTKRLANSITCAYRCMFGIADCPEGIPKETGFKSYHKNRSYLCQSGREGKFYFFAFIKNKHKTVNQSIPRYTAEDEQAVVDDYGADILRPGVTFGDIYKRRRQAVLVPLQEYVLEKCFYKRAVLIGDAFHKFNPLTGQGGNSAIEDAALLGDILKEAVQNDIRPNNSAILAGLAKFQQQRRPRTNLLRQGASSLQALEALENPLLEFMALKVIGKMSIDKLAPKFAEIYSPGHVLKYLPGPSLGGIVARDKDISAKPSQRSLHATVLWGTIMAFILSLRVLIAAYTSPGDELGAIGDRLQIYNFISTVAVNALWTVESYRPGSFFGPMYSALLYTLASTVVGWDIVLPTYFILYIYESRSQSFYYPNPRAIDIRAAEVLPTSLLIAYIPSMLSALVTSAENLAFTRRLLPASHFALPILVYLGKKLSNQDPPKSNVPDSIYGKRDIPYLLRTYNILTLACATIHLLNVSQMVLQFWTKGLAANFVFSRDLVQFMVLSIAIIVWCFFTTWDLHRTHITQTYFSSDIVYCCVAVLFIGPTATMLSTWKAREVALESSRRRR